VLFLTQLNLTCANAHLEFKAKCPLFESFRSVESCLFVACSDTCQLTVSSYCTISLVCFPLDISITTDGYSRRTRSMGWVPQFYIATTKWHFDKFLLTFRLGIQNSPPNLFSGYWADEILTAFLIATINSKLAGN
jgi:hypothetical protein